MFSISFAGSMASPDLLTLQMPSKSVTADACAAKMKLKYIGGDG